MDAHTIRRLNLAALANQLGRAKLCKKFGYSTPGYLDGCINGGNPIGPSSPRKWEKVLKLDAGWFDLPHPEAWRAAKLEEFIEIQGVASEIDQAWAELTQEEQRAVHAYTLLLKSQRP